MLDDITYCDSKGWEILMFFLKSLSIGILFIGVIYLLERFVFKESEENRTGNFIIYIIKSIIYILFVIILSIIFGYQYLVLGILLIIFFFLLSFYSIPIGIDRLEVWWLKKKYTMHLEMFAVKKEKADKWEEIKKSLINQIEEKHKNIIANKIRPKISIIEKTKSQQDKKEVILLYVEVWIKKEHQTQLNINFIKESIPEGIEKLSVDRYNEYKFHVEQEAK